jgi:hypothetical protein
VAAVANAISAAALTQVLGAYADTTCRDGEAPPMPFQRRPGAPSDERADAAEPASV